MSSTGSGDSFIRLTEELVGYGMKQGADEVEVTFLDGDEFSLDVRQGEIENLIESGSRAVSIKIILGQKTALASSSDLDPNTLRSLIRNAVQRAELGNTDPCAGLPLDVGPPIDPDSLELYDPQVSRLDSAAKIRMALDTEKIALADQRIVNSHGAGLEIRDVRSVLTNSYGVSQSFRETYCSLGVGLQAGTTDALVEGYWGSAKRHFAELDSPEAIAHKAVQRTVRQLGSRKIPTQSVPVLFEPEMTAWLMGFLFSCVSGMAVYNRASFLADRLGEKIADARINVMDHGLLPRHLGSSPFDADGVPCRATPVIENGVLKNFLCNTYAARKLGLSSTGNAAGMGVAPTNFFLKAGSSDPEEMIRNMDRGMILLRVLGHGLNPITGDISRGAFGLWVEKGEIVYPVSEITISGNLGDILKNITALGTDLEFRSAVCGPSLLVEGLTVAGL
jgi:PmbA protein